MKSEIVFTKYGFGSKDAQAIAKKAIERNAERLRVLTQDAERHTNQPLNEKRSQKPRIRSKTASGD